MVKTSCNHQYIEMKENKVCSKCNHIVYKTEIYSRVCGYLRPTSAWNDSKQAEFSDRQMFDSKPIKEESKIKQQDFWNSSLAWW